jgi:Domain of unknown function (DUF4328)
MEMPHPGVPLSAAPSPALTPGALSPDGVWRWDGLGWVPTVAAAAPAYRPLGSRPRVAAAALLLAGLTQVVGLGALTGRLSVLGRISSGAEVSLSDALHSDDVVRASAFLELGGTVLCAVLFLAWLHRVVANNSALGARVLRFTPGAAVGWWFVPFANWVMPFRVVGEAWRAADPHLPWSTPDQRAARALPGLVTSWWLALVLGSVLASVANLTGNGSGADLDALHAATLMFMAASLLLAAAAVLGAATVTRLSRRQDALHAAMSRPAEAAATA